MEGNGYKLNQKWQGQAYYLLPLFFFSVCFSNAKYKLHYTEERTCLEGSNRLYVEKLAIFCFSHGIYPIYHCINWLLGFCLLPHYNVSSGGQGTDLWSCLFFYFQQPTQCLVYCYRFQHRKQAIKILGGDIGKHYFYILGGHQTFLNKKENQETMKKKITRSHHLKK